MLKILVKPGLSKIGLYKWYLCIVRIFEVIPKTRKEDGSKYTVTKASEILDKPESVPIFRDEIEYFNRVNKLQKRLQTSQGAGTTPTQNAPAQQPVGPDAVRSNLDTLFDLNR